MILLWLHGHNGQHCCAVVQKSQCVLAFFFYITSVGWNINLCNSLCFKQLRVTIWCPSESEGNLPVILLGLTDFAGESVLMFSCYSFLFCYFILKKDSISIFYVLGL